MCKYYSMCTYAWQHCATLCGCTPLWSLEGDIQQLTETSQSNKRLSMYLLMHDNAVSLSLPLLPPFLFTLFLPPSPSPPHSLYPLLSLSLSKLWWHYHCSWSQMVYCSQSLWIEHNCIMTTWPFNNKNNKHNHIPCNKTNDDNNINNKNQPSQGFEIS